jgi:gliding motility-associated-like protein
MFSLSGYCYSILLFLISGILLPLNAQTGSWEILCDTVAGNYGYSYKDVYQNGDILSVESRGAGNQFRCTRMSADMTDQRWSFDYKFDSLLVSNASYMFKVVNIFVTQFFIDSKDQIWVQVRMDHSAIFNHVYVICIDADGKLISSVRLDLDGIKWDFHERITFQESSDGVVFYDASGGRRSSEDSILLGKFNINSTSELQLESVLNIQNSDYRNAYLQVKPRGGNLLLYDFGWASTFHLAIINQQKNTMNAWKFSSPASGFLYSAEWWSDSTLIMIFSDSQLSPLTNDLNVIVCMVDLQGKVLWTKKLVNVAILKWGEYSHEERFQDSNAQALYIPVSSLDQPTSGFVKLDARNGNILDQFFWQNPDYIQQQSLVQIIGNQFHVQMVDGTVRNASNVSTTYLINNPAAPESCFRVKHCNITSVPANVVLESVAVPIFDLNNNFGHRPGQNFYYQISAAQISVSPHCEIIQPLEDIQWSSVQTEYCPQDTLGIILSNIGFNTEIEWLLNGLLLNPVSVSQDTFFLAGNFSQSDELLLKMSRLGCNRDQRIGVSILEMPAIDFPADTSFCYGQDLTLVLPEMSSYDIKWHEGSGSTIVDQAGEYEFFVVNEAFGCKYPVSIDVQEDRIPENMLDPYLNICEEDLKRKIIVNFEDSIDMAYWLEFPEIPYTQVYLEKEGYYNLVVSSGACRDTFQTEVNFVKCSICSYYIPTAFSPNDDGINDFWGVIYPCTDPVTSFHLVLFDRWGSKIFESFDIQKRWSGAYKNTDAKVGVYSYMLEIQAEVNGQILTSTKKGNVTLLR